MGEKPTTEKIKACFLRDFYNLLEQYVAEILVEKGRMIVMFRFSPEKIDFGPWVNRWGHE